MNLDPIQEDELDSACFDCGRAFPAPFPTKKRLHRCGTANWAYVEDVQLPAMLLHRGVRRELLDRGRNRAAGLFLNISDISGHSWNGRTLSVLVPRMTYWVFDGPETAAKLFGLWGLWGAAESKRKAYAGKIARVPDEALSKLQRPSDLYEAYGRFDWALAACLSGSGAEAYVFGSRGTVTVLLGTDVLVDRINAEIIARGWNDEPR